MKIMWKLLCVTACVVIGMSVKQDAEVMIYYHSMKQ